MNIDPTQPDFVKTASMLGASLAQPVMLTHGSIPYVVLPEGYHAADLEKMMPAPVRKRAQALMYDANSFVDYVKKHGSLDSCTIYADLRLSTDADDSKNVAKYLAIIDDHGSDPSEAHWRQHTCLFDPAKSVEWTRWTGKNRKPMSQTEFAEWLEENIADVVQVESSPTGNDMLQMAMNFERNANHRFKSKTNLTNGDVSMEYVDEEKDDSKVTMRVFERFSLGLRVFLNGAGYAIGARLKYRENSGKLSFWYELIRPEKVFDQASTDLAAEIREKTGMKVLVGKPGQ